MDLFTRLANSLTSIRQLGLDSVADTLEENLRQAGFLDTVKEKMGLGKKPPVELGKNMPEQRKRETERQQNKQKQNTKNVLDEPLKRGYKVLLKNLKNYLPIQDPDADIQQQPAVVQPLAAELTSAIKKWYQTKQDASPEDIVGALKLEITKLVNKVKTQKGQEAKKREEQNAQKANKGKGTVIDKATGKPI